MTEPRQAVLSVDFELFEHTPAYRQATGTAPNAGIGLAGGEFLRDAFAERGAQTTWFVVGDVAKTDPAVVESLAGGGHEIGSHTQTHRLLTDLNAEARRTELEQSKAILEETTGADVVGFRAPAFDFGPTHFGKLAEAGYEYDSSVVSSRSIPGWYGGEYDLHRPTPATAVQSNAPSSLVELPVSVMPGLRLPLTGTWLRFFGPRYTILGMNRLAKRGITPVLYVHPWELVELPRIEGVPKRVYWHTGEWMQRAVGRILDSGFEFVTARDAIDSAEGGPAVPSGGPSRGVE